MVSRGARLARPLAAQGWRRRPSALRARHERASQDLRPGRDRGALVCALGRRGAVPAGAAGGRAVDDRHAAAQRHRLAPHRPCARQHPAGHPDPPRPDAGQGRALGRRHGPCRESPPRWWSSASSNEQQQKRTDFSREEFVAKVWEWKAESGGAITRQLRRLGASCDWANERFTMDEGFSRAVLKVFVDLYDRGLLYRDKRLVNWDPGLKTAISDLEVETNEVASKFWHFQYPLEDGSGAIHGRHHPARDDARRHGGRGASGGRALHRAGRQEGTAADHRAADPDHRRRACRSGARLGRGQDHAGPRLQRFRGRQARRLQARRDAQHARRRRAAWSRPPTA